MTHMAHNPHSHSSGRSEELAIARSGMDSAGLRRAVGPGIVAASAGYGAQTPRHLARAGCDRRDHGCPIQRALDLAARLVGTPRLAARRVVAGSLLADRPILYCPGFSNGNPAR